MVVGQKDVVDQSLPRWDNTDEYPSFESAVFKSDVDFVKAQIEKINDFTRKYKNELQSYDKNITSNEFLTAVQAVVNGQTVLFKTLWNLSSYASCELSLDAENKIAQTVESQLAGLKADLESATNPLNLFISKTTEENFQKIMADEKAKEFLFYYSHQRKMRDHFLTDAEENVISQLKKTGHLAWGQLYDAVSGTASVEIEVDGLKKKVGISEASGMTFSREEKMRKTAWLGLQKTWEEHKQSAAMVVNSLAGWRHDVNKMRSVTKKMDFLDQPLQDNRIKLATLNAMMEAIADNKTKLQPALKTMAKYLGKSQLDPWDLLAAAPIQTTEKLSFGKSFAQVREAFTQVDPEMGKFAQMMLDKNWIDASVRPKKRNGAFCTGFPKSGHPRVFQSFQGSSHDTSTLAHELGHAYHSWVMRDMNTVANDYPMTLAETASIFAEQILFDDLIKNAKTKDQKLDVYWSIAEGACALLINIPTRYEFEKNFYEKRKNGYVSADDLSALMDQSFKNWYGDTLSSTAPLFWATKLHFSIAEVSFYNFPYAFGYLFSLSLYARKNEWGKNLSQKYISILRDTGSLTAEDLIRKHLDEDITQKRFWQKSLDLVVQKVKEFEELS